VRRAILSRSKTPSAFCTVTSRGPATKQRNLRARTKRGSLVFAAPDRSTLTKGTRVGAVDGRPKRRARAHLLARPPSHLRQPMKSSNPHRRGRARNRRNPEEWPHARGRPQQSSGPRRFSITRDAAHSCCENSEPTRRPLRRRPCHECQAITQRLETVRLPDKCDTHRRARHQQLYTNAIVFLKQRATPARAS